MERRYYTPREVAELLRISPTTVMTMIHDRRLYAVHVSDRIYRVPVGAVDRLQAGPRPEPRVTETVVEGLEPVGEELPDRNRDLVGA